MEDDQRRDGSSYVEPYSLKTRLFTCILVRVFRTFSRLRQGKRNAEAATKSLQKLLIVSLRKNRLLRKELDELKDEPTKKDDK